MKKTKRNILNASRMLFNNLGYPQVTIRMIASELKMSSGNLNYHFRKKENILEALYFEMVEIFESRITELIDETLSLEFIHTNIKSNMAIAIKYRFIWADLYYLLKSNKKIRTHFEKGKTKRKAGYRFAFDILINKKILKKPSYDVEYSILIEQLIDYSNTWLYASLLYNVRKNNDEVIEDFSFRIFSMLYPYLTNVGQKNFRGIYVDYFSNKL